MPKNTKAPVDWIWGAEAIGREIGRSASQVYYLHSIGQFHGAVWKMGPKSLVASRDKLRDLPQLLTTEAVE
jgi:hypothetical protein